METIKIEGNMMPKEFIQKVLIDEIGQITKANPYLSFTLIAIGIEFLGKCLLTNCKNWHDINPSKAFNKGVELLIQEDSRYEKLNLKSSLRDGFAHTLLPKFGISLSEEKHGEEHFSINSRGKTILVVEVFYHDFVRCCKTVLERKFAADDKMNMQFLNLGK